MGCRSNYWRSCERPASTLQLMAGSRKRPLQVPVVQLFERVGKVSRQHVSRRQFFGVAHGRSGQACRSVSDRPIVNKPLGIAYGTGELPAMIASSRDYHAYRSQGHVPGDLIPIANTNHFTILDE